MALSSSAFSGELETSVTLDTYLYKTDVKSNQSGITREDFASVTDVIFKSDYDSPLFKSSLSAVGTEVVFAGDTKEGDSEFDFNWSNWLHLINESLILKASIVEQNEEISFFNTGVSDRVYDTESQAKTTIINYGARYEMQPTMPIDGSFSYDFFNRDVDWGDSRLENRNYDVATTRASIGQYKQNSGVYWILNGSHNKDGKYDGGDIISLQGSSLLRIPLVAKWYFVANNDYSTNDSSNDGLSSASNRRQSTTRNVGAGLVWAKDHNKAYFQLTREKDTVRDNYFFGADLKWPLSEKLYLSASLDRKFYGDSKLFDLTYEYKENSFSLSRNETVDMRNVLSAQQVIEGVYLCDIPEEDAEFDPDTCSMPTGLNVDIEQGKFVQTRFETLFPLIERLTLNKINEASWKYKRDKWTHTVSYNDTETKNIEFFGGQNKKTFTFSAEQRLNELSHLTFDFTYVDLSFLKEQGSNDSNTRRYTVGYTKELNSRASWGLFFERIERDIDFYEIDYRDNRLYLQYTHHFGVDNKKIRPIN